MHVDIIRCVYSLSHLCLCRSSARHQGAHAPLRNPFSRRRPSCHTIYYSCYACPDGPNLDVGAGRSTRIGTDHSFAEHAATPAERLGNGQRPARSADTADAINGKRTKKSGSGFASLETSRCRGRKSAAAVRAAVASGSTRIKNLCHDICIYTLFDEERWGPRKRRRSCPHPHKPAGKE